MKKITVFLSDDRAAFREGLRLLLKAANRNGSFSPPSAARLFEQAGDGNGECGTSGASVLSDQQTEIVKLIAQGNSSKEIARLLSLSIKTVEKRRQAAMKKLNIHEIASLTRYAVFAGIIECCHPVPGRDAPFLAGGHRLPNNIKQTNEKDHGPSF